MAAVGTELLVDDIRPATITKCMLTKLFQLTKWLSLILALIPGLRTELGENISGHVCKCAFDNTCKYIYMVMYVSM